MTGEYWVSQSTIISSSVSYTHLDVYKRQSLDYIVAVDQFELGKTNRTSSEQLLPGGKGVNVSAVLHSLGVENTALGFLAGFTGREIEARIRQSGISCGFIFLEKGCSRINIKMKDFDGTEINGAGPDIDETSLNRLMGQLNCLERGDTLVLAGSIPASMPKDIYSRILDMLKERGVLFAAVSYTHLDVYKRQGQ